MIDKPHKYIEIASDMVECLNCHHRVHVSALRQNLNGCRRKRMEIPKLTEGLK